MKLFSKLFAVLLALSAALPAGAVSIDLGTITDSITFDSKDLFGIDASVSATGNIVGNFEHQFQFTIGKNTGLSGFAFNVFFVDSFGSKGEIANFAGSLDRINKNDQVLSSDPLTNDITPIGSFTRQTLFLENQPVILAPGLYQLALSGEGIGLGGQYVGNIVLTDAPAAVPVPAAVWLLGSGLTGLIAVGRRRV